MSKKHPYHVFFRIPSSGRWSLIGCHHTFEDAEARMEVVAKEWGHGVSSFDFAIARLDIPGSVVAYLERLNKGNPGFPA